MKIMNSMKLLFFVVILTPIINIYSHPKYTPNDFGLRVKHGQIEKSKMTKEQKDTIVIGMFNYEDYLQDIAVYHKSQNAIIIYRNEGNGKLSEYRKIEIDVGNKLKRIEAVTPKDIIYNPNQRQGLELYYENGEEKLLKDREIIYGETESSSKTPLRDFTYDGKVFLYGLNWVEQWRSERNGTPTPKIEVGDLDRDGKSEVVYTFWPMNGQPYPTHMVVFECVNQGQYRIDWDTTFPNGGYNNDFLATDFDEDGNKEFFGYGHSQMGSFNLGLYECSGEGKYKYRECTFLNIKLPFGIDYSDTINVDGIKGRGMWMLYSDIDGGYNSTEIQKYRFKQKYPNYYNFELYFKNAWLHTNGFCYSIAGCDIDKDGKEEVVLGDTQWDTDYIVYYDSTGISTNIGYEYKEIIPNAPISGGYIVSKDLDNDGYKEITVCGIGNSSGSIGTVKHTGNPGENQFTTVWWDSSDVCAMPNMGIDTGSIDNVYSVLFPSYYLTGGPPTPREVLHLYTYTRTSIYNFNMTTKMLKDSLCFIGAKLYDMDRDGKQNVIAPFGIFLSAGNYYLGLMALKQIGTIGVHTISTEIPKDYKLYQNYPNPFNQSTIIKMQIPITGNVSICIYDITGKRIETLINQKQNTGTYCIKFDGGSLSSGVYFYSLFVNEKRLETRKMLLIK